MKCFTFHSFWPGDQVKSQTYLSYSGCQNWAK